MFETLYNLDYAIFRFINESLSSPVLNLPIYLITYLGSFYCVVAFAIASIFIERPWSKKILLTLLVLGTIFEGVKFIVGRERPYVAHQAVLPFPHDNFIDPSFPSGHTAFAFGMAFLLAQRYKTKRVLFYCAAVLVGFSRMYLGMHYPSDVLGGIAFGLIIPYLLERVFQKSITHS
jgi:undecaprenyl-diphosphatase